MQTIFKNKNYFYKINLKSFADWTSNATTGEVITRNIRHTINNQNSYSVFNRNKIGKSLSKQTHYQSQSEKDFPNDEKRLAYLIGNNKK